MEKTRSQTVLEHLPKSISEMEGRPPCRPLNKSDRTAPVPLAIRPASRALARAPLRPVLLVVVFLTGSALLAVPPAKPLDLSPVKAWLLAQKDVRSVSADFTQTRALRTLRSPLTSKGRLWLKSPNWFRWELGDPPKTIIIGTPGGLTVIQPGKKRAERKPLATADGAPGDSEALGMIRFPGGGSFEDFQRRVQVLGIEVSGSKCHLEMLPRDAQSARRLSAIKMDFDTVTGHWLSFEIVTREGSSIRNEFSNVEINPKIDNALFDYDLTGFRISDEEN